jgi:tetratricopeptide (TPR) repeat protein
MSNLASVYDELGRHEDAVAMGEKALEFKRRVVPENHPDIGAARLRLLFEEDFDFSTPGYAMNSLANTYVHLGRYQDALAMGEKALEFRRRVLPANHPDIGAARIIFWLFE